MFTCRCFGISFPLFLWVLVENARRSDEHAEETRRKQERRVEDKGDSACPSKACSPQFNYSLCRRQGSEGQAERARQDKEKIRFIV